MSHMSAHPGKKEEPATSRVVPQIAVVVIDTSIQISFFFLFKRQRPLVRAHVRLVVLCQRIPTNHCGLHALLRNDAHSGLEADLETPDLQKMNAPNICHDAVCFV